MTFEELSVSIKAYANKYKRENRDKAIYDYKLARLIAANVGNIIDNKNNVPKLYEVYEGFEEFKKLEEQLQAEQQWKAIKARVEQYNTNWKASKGGV